MKRSGNIKFPVLFATAYLFVYLMVVYFSTYFGLAFLTFSLSPVVLTWMAFRILKGNYSGTLTFDESFYEDWKGKNQ